MSLTGTPTTPQKDSRSSAGTSPSKPSSSAGNHARLGRDASGAMRDLVSNELKGQIKYDSESVFRRLQLKDQEVIAGQCAKAMAQNVGINGAISTLKKIVAAAEGKTLGELLQEEDTAATKKIANERKMYQPLSDIFTFIEEYSNQDNKNKYSRHFTASSGQKFTKETTALGFPQLEPDFFCFDEKVKPGQTVSDESKWRIAAAFVEVKPSSKQGPKPSDSSSDSTVLPLASQSADYARLHLSARPFQLFSVGLLIFGNNFCVGIHDREGIVFSPIYSIWDDLKLFIQVIRCISCELSPVELGQDPTVKLITSEHELFSKVKLSSQTSKGTRVGDYPNYIVSLGGSDGPNQAKWVTIGAPLWNSFSLLGRGTSVWKVCPTDMQTEKMFIMKDAWRKSSRNSESEIYKTIAGNHHAGVARFETGQDVRFPGKEDLITVANLRADPPHEGTKILHRLFLSTLGRPLYDYPSEVVLLKALRAAIQGHQRLSKNNVLHRDVSIGNVFISNNDNPEPGEEGFIADLDYASIEIIEEKDVKQVPFSPQKNPQYSKLPPTEGGTRTHIKFTTKPALRGAMMTGTVQFMAYEVLVAIHMRKNLSRRVHHDLESFVWVLVYAVRRRLLQAGKNEVNYSDFSDIFGEVKISKIMRSRSGGTPLMLDSETSEDLVSPAMISLFTALQSLVQRAHFIDGPTPLTYTAVIGTLDRTINELGG